MESTKRKLEASEEKWFWSQVLLKWWRHQKQVEEKHFIKSYITRSCLSSDAEDHQQIERVKVSKDLFTSNITEEWSNNQFERIWKHWMLVLSRALKKDNCTKCTTTTYTTLFVSLHQDKNNSCAWNNVPSD